MHTKLLSNLKRGTSEEKVYALKNAPENKKYRFVPNKVLGQGSYGVVCSAVDRKTGDHVALKYMRDIFDDLIGARRVWREICILRILKEYNCRHILPLLYIEKPLEPISSYKEVCIATGLYSDSLATLISERRLDFPFIAGIIGNLLCSLADMHRLGFIHRDIKPANILLKNKNDALSTILCDFGLCRGGLNRCKLPMEMTDYVVTRWYRAPELLLGSSYDYKVDVWALGCVFAECSFRKPLFPGKNYIHQLQLLVEKIPILDDSHLPVLARKYLSKLLDEVQESTSLKQVLHFFPSKGLDLVEKMLVFEPEQRISALAALSEPFFQGLYCCQEQKLSEIEPTTSFDVDFHAEISENQIRRLIWDEIHRYHEESES